MARIRSDEPRDGKYVLYWCTSARRTKYNRALNHAANVANNLGIGLVVFDALRLEHPYSSERLHEFVRQGMQDMHAGLQETGAVHIPYIEPTRGDGKGKLAELARDAALIVCDDAPIYFLRHAQQAAKKLGPLCFVDDNGLLPLDKTDGPFATAYSFRRFLHKTLPEVLDFPEQEMAKVQRIDVSVPWASDLDMDLSQLDYCHDVAPVSLRGGEVSAQAQLDGFLERLDQYPESNHPDLHAASGLSPYLHFGHISSSDVVRRVLELENWSPSKFGKPSGKRTGFWGVSEAADAFLDQIITWRELGYVEMHHRPEATTIDTLPDWAKLTIEVHRDDQRIDPGLDALENAETDDPIWNAAQRELLETGVMQNYLRMLWGKKIYEWSTPEQALERMFYLNDKYALDGRDPNSVSGIMWCLGRYDRAWGERDVFGKLRCMTSDSTKRKLKMAKYLERFS